MQILLIHNYPHNSKGVKQSIKNVMCNKSLGANCIEIIECMTDNIGGVFKIRSVASLGQNVNRLLQFNVSIRPTKHVG